MRNKLHRLSVHLLLTMLLCLAAMHAVCATDTTVTGSFPAIEGYDIATVRYVQTVDGTTVYRFADISGSAEAGYSYSFPAPDASFVATEGSNLSPEPSATVIAEYYCLTRWDGAVDVSWYNETDTDFYLYTPAELAGLAAIVNGSVDSAVSPWQVKGLRTDPAVDSRNGGLPDCIENTYFASTNLIAGVVGPAHKGVMAHDFADRTIHLMADMDMGGVDGSEIVMGQYDIKTDQPDSNWNRNLYDYPNWTPIGGEYLMDVTDSDSMIIAFFNGTLEGHGHYINNLYCYRWSYRSVGETAFGYSQGVGLIGDMGTLYDDSRGKESNPETLPAVRNLGLSGFVYGRRMVGGFVGCIGGGSNAADGTSVPGGIRLENLVNHAYVYCTDSKGLGGIVGCAMTVGSIINCYNDGTIRANYDAPTGGIVGSNEGMDVFCCYNTGSIYALSNYGRGIGSDRTGRDYKVDNCFYLENCANDPDYPGYYTYNLASSVYVHVTEASEAVLKSQSTLNSLNQNGLAYVRGDGGYPVLYWEKERGTGTLTVEAPQGGTLTAGRAGELENGTVVYLENTPDTGWSFRYYTCNGNPMTGDYVTVNGSTTVSAYYESVKAGVINITPNAVCNISITKNGVVLQDSTAVRVTDYPVASGDPVYEGDLLIVKASVKEGMVPDDPGFSYRDSVGAVNPFDFIYQYTDGEPFTTNVLTYTVTTEILREGAALTLTVVPLTTQKLWRHQGNTDWYVEAADSYSISTPEELAGFAALVNSGVSFAGKTVALANDISLDNNDGTSGTRYWDGIGAAGDGGVINAFAGTFDGQGHSITGFHGCKNGLFGYCYGSTGAPAVIRNLTLYGEATGQNASGITAYLKNARIENCDTYCAISGGSGWVGGIAGYVQANGNLENCHSYGNISATGKVGGISGEVVGTAVIKNCINTGDLSVLSTTGSSVGGVVGSLSGTLTACASYGNITAYGRNVGGVAGQSVSASASITDCYNTGTLTMKNCTTAYDCVGGILGFASYYKVYRSFNYGTIVADSSVPMVGGVFGREGKRSTSRTENVFYPDTASPYAENNIPPAELPELTYCAGIQVASVADFSDPTGILQRLNQDGCFALTNGTYPELTAAAQLHVHTGGQATCSDKAVCSSCGLEYGNTDPTRHAELVLRNVTEPAWVYSGYTGDQCCRSCGAVVEAGEAIPADTTANALTVQVYRGTTLLSSTDYTIAEFDALKETGPYLVYGYGSKSEEIMVCTEYVTISALLTALGYQNEALNRLEVICPGVNDTLTADVLNNCRYYFDKDGNATPAPAALAITYASMAAAPSVAAHAAQAHNSLRFGYGISTEQYQNNTSLGGRRLISPVDTVRVYLAEAGTTVSGEIEGYSGSGQVTLTLTAEGAEAPAYTTTGTDTYRFSGVAPGTYTLKVSADGLYVDHCYTVTVTDDALVQKVTIYQLGDVDMDGRIRNDDATRIARHLARVAPITDAYALQLADTNRSGSVTIADATHLARYCAQLDPAL